MISVSVKGEQIVDHYGLMSLSELQHNRWTKSERMSTSQEGHTSSLHSGIEEYDPNEEYDEGEDEYEEEDEVKWGSNQDSIQIPLTTQPPILTTTEGSSFQRNSNFLRFLKKLSNTTRDTGMDVRLACEAEGIPPPRGIKWYKNGVQDQLRGDRFRVKHTRRKTAEGKKSPIRIVGSTLKIKKLEFLDKGFYTCEVFGGNGQKISSTGILDVIHDAALESGVIPDFPSAFETFPEIGESGSIHRIDSFHRVPIIASNTGHNNVDVSLLLIPPKDGNGICQKYRGTICRKYLENRTIYIHSEESQILLESKLKDAITLIKQSPNISDRCSTFGVPSLCYYYYPLCDSSITPRRQCREECELLEENICVQEYSLVRHHPLLGKQIPLPQCSLLPPLGSLGGRKCIKLEGLPLLTNSLPLLEETQPCYKDKGEEYRGTFAETQRGSKCTSWSKQNKFKPKDYPELMGGHNFCRNPGGVEASPWCFIESGRRERCGVEQCGFFGYDDKLWMTVGGGLAALFLFLICMLLCCLCRGFSSKNKKKKKQPSSILSSPELNIQHLEMNSLIKKLNGHAPKVPEVSVNNVHLYEEMGLGAFGKVYKGEVILRPGENAQRVVIKTLKCSATAKTRQDFFREVELMGELKHPNILCLLGVVTKEEPRCMLFEYMANGDLHEFLISHSPRGEPNLTEFVLEANEMLFIATQIAAGMEYLAAHHYVHRDIAARNALVGDGLTVKISDFGLSREIYNSDYYRVHSTSLVPVRWMPPEAIMYGKFSTESDVYSFGVILWEIYSYGLQPYFGYTTAEVLEIIRSRQLLPCPELCPPKMYSLMIECWSEVPQRRPSFEELHSRLKQWLLPLLGPNSNFSPHINIANSNSSSHSQQQGPPPPFPFVAPPSCASNNSVSSHQSSNATGPLSNNTNSTSVSNQWSRNNMQTFQPNNHCVAYQSTPVYNNYQNGQVQATAHFNGGTGRISHSHSPNSVHYRVFMESKSTNI